MMISLPEVTINGQRPETSLPDRSTLGWLPHARRTVVAPHQQIAERVVGIAAELSAGRDYDQSWYSREKVSLELEFRYTVFAYSSFHLMGDAEKYSLGEFGDCASAVAACEKVIDDFFLSIRQSPSSPETLREDYENSGPEPYIASDDPACWFSAADYVRRRVAGPR